MNHVSYSDFFSAATGLAEPFKFQEDLAVAPDLPELVDVPTGLGKTAAAILGWLYRRRFHPEPAIRRATPRRLVYCLPMRVLVEQTYAETVRWLNRLGLLAGIATWENGDGSGPLEHYEPQQDTEDAVTGWAAEHEDKNHRIAVHLLMGGETPTGWVLWPERDAILIGTQDMLLSRALNRGYAASRARWPMEFGLLHNDCLWVFDEVQLMGNGVATTAQLQAFQAGGKQPPGWGCFQGCGFLWTSATLRPDWLDTVDHAAPSAGPFGLSAQEKQAKTTVIGKRMHAPKRLHKTDSDFDKKPAALAREIVTAHRAANGGEREPILTLAVVNTVDRAVDLHAELLKLAQKEKVPPAVLIHSHFRPPDRAEQIRQLIGRRPREGMIAVSTQVVEAGVDVSAKVLFTELAPWASLVQRFGRCNRKGEYAEAEVHWVDVSEKQAAPYDSEELEAARGIVRAHAGGSVGPAALEELMARLGAAAMDQLYTQHPIHVLRRKDLLELFDTTPDLAGNDIDVSRYIRESEQHDVQVFWRDIPKDAKPDDTTAPARRDELCSVPVGKLRDFLAVIKKSGKRLAWRWDFLDGEWAAARPEHVFPGQVFMLDREAGGYSRQKGWTGKADGPVTPLPPVDGGRPDATDTDAASALGVWQSIALHTDEVCRELDAILDALSGDLPEEALRLAARWHDRGKAHPAFMAKLTDEALRSAECEHIRAEPAGQVAKAPKNCWKPGFHANVQRPEDGRRHLRHELASALALLQTREGLVLPKWRDLAAYLVAAHHGKVRLSIRSLPGEFRPKEPHRRFARGIWEGDSLPPTALGDLVVAPQTQLDLEPMELGLGGNGEPSWAERMLALRDAAELGPLRLAYLEAILRAADWRASARAEMSKEIDHA